jgi:uncharacterized protein (DUF2252 family)
MPRLGVLCSLLLSACGLSACGGARTYDDGRTALIVTTLIEADRELLYLRAPEVALKYEEMATTPQAYLRGTAALYFRDMTRQLGSGTLPHGAGAELVDLVGDLHLENIGATFDADAMLLDVIDHDASVPGPFHWDVRRAALAVATALGMADQPDALIGEVTSALAGGYLFALAEAQAGRPLGVQRRGAIGRVFDDLLDDAERRKTRREELTRYAAIVDGERRMLRNEELAEVPEPFRDLDQALAGYRATRSAGRGDDAAFVIKDFVLRLGAGIASRPNLRFYVLCEGPPGLADDLMLELKEQRDPPPPLLLLGRGPVGASNAARIIAGTRRLASSPSIDPDLGHVTFHGVSFQVRTVSRARRDLDVLDLVSDINRGTYGPDDLIVMGTSVGRVLGAAHARAGNPARILAAAGDPAAYRATVAADALADRIELLADYERFKRARTERGPLLGFRP